jgi:hypothetical protein
MQCVFRLFLEINTVLHPLFDLSIRGKVPGNVSVILTVPNAVFWVKACNEIGDRVLRSLCCLDLNANILVFYLFETIFVCFLSIFYNLAHSHIKETSFLTFLSTKSPWLCLVFIVQGCVRSYAIGQELCLKSIPNTTMHKRDVPLMRECARL